jgi:hypothetical protein
MRAYRYDAAVQMVVRMLENSLDATDKDVSIGGAGLAAAAIELGLVDELACSAIRSSLVAGRLPSAGHRRCSSKAGRDQDVRARVIYERYGRARDESD